MKISLLISLKSRLSSLNNHETHCTTTERNPELEKQDVTGDNCYDLDQDPANIYTHA